jgi:hypothetical protein
MAKLYRKEILKEPEIAGFVSLGEIKPVAAAPAPAKEEDLVAGD